MEKVALPAYLRNFMSVPSCQILTIGAEKIPLRAGLQNGTFMIGGVINQGMEKASLPASEEKGALPISLQTLANGVRCLQGFSSCQCTSRTRRSPTSSPRS